MTQPENLARQAYQAMVLIVSIASDQDQWTDSDFITRLQSCNKDLAEVLEQTANMIEGFQGHVPAYFDTLHALYTAYEVGKAVLSFTAYMGRQGKNVYKTQAEENTPLVEVTNRLLVTVEKQCGVIKKGMDEGWIDKVLECAMGEGTLLDEDNFMEEWAGEVVESWRESVAGLSYLKAS
jgi:N-terminal acetyltransferase B complex non-catalytic subunit